MGAMQGAIQRRKPPGYGIRTMAVCPLRKLRWFESNRSHQVRK